MIESLGGCHRVLPVQDSLSGLRVDVARLARGLSQVKLLCGLVRLLLNHPEMVVIEEANGFDDV